MKTEPVPKTRSRVFVIDDDPAVLRSLKFSLTADGYDVAAHSTAASFLAVVNRVTTDTCVVVDHVLPHINGLGVAAELRSLGITAPVILIAGNPSPVVRREASFSGIRLVEKPLIPGFLNAAIRSALRSRRASK